MRPFMEIVKTDTNEPHKYVMSLLSIEDADFIKEIANKHLKMFKGKKTYAQGIKILIDKYKEGNG